MPDYEITAPDGSVFEITAPEGATEQQILEFAQANMSQQEFDDPTVAERVGGGILGIGQGLSYGGLDEIQAGLTAAGATALDKLGIDQLLTGKEYEKSFQETYEDDLAKTRQRMAQAAEQTPIEYYGGQVVGGVATAPVVAATAPGQAFTRAVTQGPLLNRALSSGAVGALSGGAYGFGTGEGGLEERLESAKTGAKYGGIGGGAMPIAGSAIKGVARTVAPKIDEAIQPLARRAREMGIPLSVEQVAPSKARTTLQKVSQDLPFSGVDDFIGSQRKAFNKAVARTIGQESEDLGPEVIEAFKKSANEKFSVVTRNKEFNITDDIAVRLDDLVSEAYDNVGDELGKIVERQAVNLAKSLPAGQVSGNKLAALRSQLIKKTPNIKGEAKQYVGDMVTLIDDTITPLLDDAERATLQTARREWRNFKTLEPLLEKSKDGSINPTDLLNRVAASKYIRASETPVGRDDLVDLARIGKSLLPARGGSDTQARMLTAGGVGAAGSGYVAPVTTATALTGNRAFQSLYNQNPRMVDYMLRAAQKGNKSGFRSPAIGGATARTASNANKPPNIMKSLTRDESGSASVKGGALTGIGAGALSAPTVINVSPPNPDGSDPLQGTQGIPDVQAPYIQGIEDRTDTRQPLTDTRLNTVDELLDKIAFAESSGNPNAKAKTSSASGLFQFTNGTWRSMVKRYGKDYGIGVKDKNDPNAQRTMATLLLQENSNILEKKLERQPNQGELYMAHVFGPSRAAKLIKALPENPPAIRLVPRQVAQANRAIFYDGNRPKRVSEVYEMLEGKVA